MKKILLIWSVFANNFIIVSQTGNKVQAQAPATSRDTSINAGTSYSEIFFDSTKMENLLLNNIFMIHLIKRMRNFYNARNYQFAWFFKEGMADYASSFYEVYNDYISYSQDSTLKATHYKQLYDSLINRKF